MALLLSASVPEGVIGQEIDTSRTTPPDSLRAPADTTRSPQRIGTPLPYAGPQWGEAAHDTLPILRPALDATDLLSGWPGSFVYRLGPVGWPDGWSPEGLGPQRPTLTLGGLPFDDPLTGCPRYDLLPLAWLEPLRIAPAHRGTPYAVHTSFRPYSSPEPLTELRYRTRANGLQSIMGVHVQQRRLQLFGTPGIIQILGGYGGHASDGEYAGSRLRRGRQLYGRLRYAQPRWSLELANLHNRRHVGAHAGVIVPEGRPYEAIYNRFGAQVRETGAERQTIRNDVALTARVRLVPRLEAPLTLTAYWTAQTFRYRGDGTDAALAAETDRYGLRTYQDVHWRSHRLRLRAATHVDRPGASNVFATAPGTQTRTHLALLDSTRLLGIDIAAEVAVHAADDLPLTTGNVSLSLGDGRRRVFAEAVYAGQPVPWVARYGFGETLMPLGHLPVGRSIRAKVGAAARLGPLDAAVTLFAHDISQPIDYYRPAADSFRLAIAHAADGSFRRVGASLDLGLRRDAERGFYLVLRPSVTHFVGASRTAMPAAGPVALAQQRAAASVPLAYARGRAGARYRLFQGDLDLDLYLRGAAWTRFRSRVFHSPTGLLVLPQTDARTIGPSGTLDVVAEAGIRAAIVFIAYENVLAGRTHHGTLIVPDYPLPEQRLRVGIYWPIFG